MAEITSSDAAPGEGASGGAALRKQQGTVTTLVFLLLLAIAVPARFAMLREPLNSDDNSTMTAARAFVRGTHPLQRRLTPTTQGGRQNHHVLRLGLVLPVALAIRVFGDGFVAYYVWPFAFSILAIALVFLVLHRLVGNTVAFLACLVQVFNPLEVERSSVLLTNLPVAALTVCLVLLLYAIPEERRGWRRDVLIGCIMGLLLGWSYLLRESAPAGLLPFFVAGLLLRRYRRAVLVSLVVLFVLVMGEQLLYMSRGGEFGYRAHNMALDIENYKPYLYHTDSLSRFVLRYPRVAARFGDMLGFYFYVAILCHVYLLVFSRDAPVRILAACGLFDLAMYTFSVFAPLSEGFVAMPPQTRFVQTFLVTSVVSVAWTLWHVPKHRIGPLVARFGPRRRLGERLLKKLPRIRVLTPMASWTFMAACFLLFFIPCVKGSLNLRKTSMLSISGNYMSILLGINAVMEENGLQSVEIIGTPRGISAIGMFNWLPPHKRLQWSPHSIEECVELIEKDSASLFVTDFARLRSALPYVRNVEARAERAEEIDRLEKVARERMEPVRSNGFFLLAKSRALK